MILRNAAVRHGRTLASPISRAALRQLSTQSPDTTDPSTPASTAAIEATSAWATSQALKQTAAPSPPKLVKSSRRKQSKYVQESIYSMSIDTSAAHQGRSWSDPHRVGEAELTAEDQWKEFRRIQKETKRLGSDIVRRYSPSALLNNPPAPEDVSLELLMASQTHMGHHRSLWNPANARYIYGVREKIHIISLETTAAHLRRAARVVEEVAYRGGIILFVGTRKGQMEVVTKAAEMAGACHIFTKWAPGSITNRDVMLDGHMSKVVNEHDKTLPDFDTYRDSARPLMPDLVVCLNPMENYTLLYECGLKTIPTIGVIDTDADPTWVTYTIPANDDSLRSVGLIAGVLGRAGKRGQARRTHDTARGVIPWETTKELSEYMSEQRDTAQKKRKEVMGQMQQYQGLNVEEEAILGKGTTGAIEVGEDAMLAMLGQAAGEAPAVEKLSVESIETQLDAVRVSTLEVEEALQGQAAAEKLSVEAIEAQLDAMRVSTLEVEEALQGSTKA